jgi:hypothetical protein
MVPGYIAVRTTALAENSTVAKMEKLVEEAQNSRSKTQRLIDSCAKYYTPGTHAPPLHGHNYILSCSLLRSCGCSRSRGGTAAAAAGSR